MKRTVVMTAALAVVLLVGGCGDTDTGCQPDCAGKECGQDGCGGECSPGCGAGETCGADGLCECLQDCAEWCCGDDRCGGICPNTCVPGEVCDPDTCTCVPDCDPGLHPCNDGLCHGCCGDDHCQPDEICDADHTCVVKNDRQCQSGGGAGDCMWDADCPSNHVCKYGCNCVTRDGIEDCTCTDENDCETPLHCVDCKCQEGWPWCEMNFCFTDDDCSAEGNICSDIGGRCVMDDRYDICYCVCNP